MSLCRKNNHLTNGICHFLSVWWGREWTHVTFMYCMIPGHLASWPWKTFLSWSYAPQRNNYHFLVHRYQVLLWPLSHCLWFFPYAFVLLLHQWVSTLSAQNLGLKNIWVCKPLATELEFWFNWPGRQLGLGIHSSSLGDGNMQVGLEQLWLTSAHSGSNTTSFTWYPSICHRVWYMTSIHKSAVNYIPNGSWNPDTTTIPPLLMYFPGATIKQGVLGSSILKRQDCCHTNVSWFTLGHMPLLANTQRQWHCI